MVLYKLSVSSSERDVVGAYTWTVFSWYLSVTRRTSMLLWNSQRILLACCLSISYLGGSLHPVHMLASEWCSRWPLWRVVKLSYFLRTSPSLAITSHIMLFSFSSSSSYCTCSSFRNVLTLYVAIFSRSPLVWWFLLTQRFLAPPVCGLSGPEPPPRSHTYGADVFTLTNEARSEQTCGGTDQNGNKYAQRDVYNDRRTNPWVRNRTKVIDITGNVRKMKWFRAEHNNRIKDDR